MAPKIEKSPQWWDRENDDLGVPIRSDVRQAAHEIWPNARRHVRSVFGDISAAAELMEAAVARISRHLDRNGNSALTLNDVCAILMLHFCQAVHRRANKLRRMQPAGTVADIGKMGIAVDWVEDVDRRIDFEKLLLQIKDRSCIIIGMRTMECTWKEIGRSLGIAPSTARNAFWEDIRKAKAMMVHRKRRLGKDSL